MWLGIVIVFISRVGSIPLGEGFGPPDPNSRNGGPGDGWVVHPSICVAVGCGRGPGGASDLLEAEVGGFGERPFDLLEGLPRIEGKPEGDGVEYRTLIFCQAVVRASRAVLRGNPGSISS